MRFVTTTCMLVLFTSVAAAGPALDDNSGSGSGSAAGSGSGASSGSSASGSGSSAPTTTGTENPGGAWGSPDKIHYGFDIRLREVYLPKALIELFIDHAAGGTQNTGYGFDLVRKRGNLELQLGFEYEKITPAAGVYINKGDSPNIAPNSASQAAVDYILPGSNFAWYTVEFTFLNHAEITKYLAFRYGGGVGLGILAGSIPRYKVFCGAGASSPSNLEPQCVPQALGGDATLDNHDLSVQPSGYSLPPVFPVVNAILGFQIRPIDKLVINIEGGIRTLPFFGASIGYFF